MIVTENPELITMDIVGITPDALVIEGPHGGRWNYKSREELPQGVRIELEKRQSEGWKVLGVAHFEQRGQNLLILKDMGL